jgi:hypothetical protein
MALILPCAATVRCPANACLADYRTRTEARSSLFDYTEVFYNRQRQHSLINYEAPLAFEHQQPPNWWVRRSWGRSSRPLPDGHGRPQSGSVCCPRTSCRLVKFECCAAVLERLTLALIVDA